MRLAAVFALMMLAACGEPAAKAHPSAGDPLPDDVALDDSAIGARVVGAARSRGSSELARMTLPPRCDRVRIAVHLLQEQLLGALRDGPDHVALLRAFGELAKSTGGASPAALGPLVGAWTKWTDADRAAEKELALHYAQALDLLQRDADDPRGLEAILAVRVKPPASSVTAAQLAALRAAAVALSTPGDGVTAEIAQALESAQAAFDALGWPGGFGSIAAELSQRLLRANPDSARGFHVAELAQAAFARSSDELRAALAFASLAQTARSKGRAPADLQRAEHLADAARERLLRTRAHGREVYDVLRLHGELAQVLGKQREAARDLGLAVAEATHARLGVAAHLAVAEPLANSLVLLGRFDDALAAARAAAKVHDDAVTAGASPDAGDRAQLDELAAQAALEKGDAADAVDLFRSAARRYDELAKSEPRWAAERDTATILAARAQVRAGAADAAAATIATVLAREGLLPSNRASAASVLREARRFDDAEKELARAEAEIGSDAEVFLEERARLAAARGETETARALFTKALDSLTHGSDEPRGWDAARVRLDWARMETSLGRLFEASELAARAVGDLKPTGLEWELDRARTLFVDLQRRRGWFLDAERVAAQRVEAIPDSDPRREDALLDLLFIRIELSFQKVPDAEKRRDETARSFPEGWRRALALDPKGTASSVPVDAPVRWKALAGVARGLPNSEGALGEPELRRWSARSAIVLDGSSAEEGIERRRSGDVATVDPARVASAGEALLLVEPLGDRTFVSLLANGRVRRHEVTGDAGLAAFWDACWVAPTGDNLRSSAAGVAKAVLGGGIGEALRDVRRLWISVPEPLGPLPFDLLPYGEGTLLDHCEVMTVASVHELTRARERTASPRVAELVSPYATLDGRNSLVHVGAVDESAQARLRELLGQAMQSGKDVSAALREAKLAMRREWTPDAKRPTVPPWAAYLLRGTP